MKAKLQEEIQLPNGVTATNTQGIITMKGPKGESTRSIKDPAVNIKLDNNTITLSTAKGTKRQKRIINTYVAHLQNMIHGVQQPYTYLLKICSGHFPMNVSISGTQLTIKNFLGEKSPRTLTLKKNVSIKIEGDLIAIESPNKELAGQMASDIELLTAKANRDLRVFQDGIYMIEKAGKKIFEP